MYTILLLKRYIKTRNKFRNLHVNSTTCSYCIFWFSFFISVKIKRTLAHSTPLFKQSLNIYCEHYNRYIFINKSSNAIDNIFGDIEEFYFIFKIISTRVTHLLNSSTLLYKYSKKQVILLHI